ncbi:MAG: hypothetical protein J2P41_01945, partial [Blastocatellia bacterium]|nr:hypothetical protein [Blastocatellia bacterium]
VTEAWAWTHHPGWFRSVTGRNPREAYEQAVKRQAARARVLENWEREQASAEQTPARPSSGSKGV